jgi:hypothetical protein
MKNLAPKPDHVCLPVLGKNADTLTRHFHAEFMHAFQGQRGDDETRRVFAAIAGAAQNTGAAPETVAGVLVDSGLRAARQSFPEKFVRTLEGESLAPDWNIAGLSAAQRELAQHWRQNASPLKTAAQKEVVQSILPRERGQIIRPRGR